MYINSIPETPNCLHLFISVTMDRSSCESKMKKKKIGIIGAGISGLLACKYTIQKGFSPIVFDARDSIGGVWSNTITSTRLQTPKSYYQFSDFLWADSVKDENFPDHNQVMDYLYSYAQYFDILGSIKFNSKVVGIDYVWSSSSEEHSNDDQEDYNNMMSCWELWGGNGLAFSPSGKWNLIVQHVLHSSPPQVYEVDFVILCIGIFSDLPNIPQFPMNKGPEVFYGKVIHSMDYAAMGSLKASEFIKHKRVAVVGFQKSALDIAAEVAKINGVRNPCTLIFKTTHWTVPAHLNEINFRNLNRFSEFMVHKPGEGFLMWLLAFLLSPLLWIFSKAVESYLKWIYPLKKYKMVPEHSYLKQICTCMQPVLPLNFYDRVKEGSIVLKKLKYFNFCKNGLKIEDDENVTPLETDIVIFATGYKSDLKFANIFKSPYFQKCITGSSAPFYRECIHPRIPQLAILGYSEHPSALFTTEMRAKWVANFMAGGFKLPTIREMEENVMRWENCLRHYGKGTYKRSCGSVLLQIYCNDELCRDMNYNPKRKKNIFSEFFSPYSPLDYANVL